MKMVIHPGKMNGEVAIPASKSMMQRVCAAALLHHGKTTITHAGHSQDDMAALAVIQQLGAKVKRVNNGCYEIQSAGINPISEIINCGESGLSARLFTPISALSDRRLTITGSGALPARPMDSFKPVFAQLGLSVFDFSGRLPISLKGPMVLRDIEVDGALSSQFLTGLLFAYAYSAKEHFTIEVKNLTSKPYINLTLAVLRRFGISIAQKGYKAFHIEPYKPLNKDMAIDVEGDWSSAAFWLAGGALNGSITIKGLDKASTQADKKILDILHSAGGSIKENNDGFFVEKSLLRSFEFDAADSPDLFPILAIFATQCEGKSIIKGLNRLLHKESDRVESISRMLAAFGVEFSIEQNSLVINGAQRLKACTIDSCNDHRIAMAAAIGATIASGAVTINDAHCVAKSYPGFYKDLARIGINTQSVL